MAEKSWSLVFEGDNHIVELNHSYFSGKRIIRLDGKVIDFIKRNLFDRGSNYSFNVGNHNCIVLIKPSRFTFKYDLIVDSVSLETGERIDVDKDLKEKMEEWRRMQEKGKIYYIFINGLLYGTFQGLLFGFVLSLIQEKKVMKFYSIFGILSYTIWDICGTIFKWNKYNKMFGKINDV